MAGIRTANIARSNLKNAAIHEALVDDRCRLLDFCQGFTLVLELGLHISQGGQESKGFEKLSVFGMTSHGQTGKGLRQCDKSRESV